MTPTVTPTPTSTPDATATALYAGWQAELENFVQLGDLGAMEGSFTPYADFEKESAQIGSYQGVPLAEAGTEFLFGAHLKWSTAIQNPELSGCGLIFGLQPNRDHYAVILDQSRIILLMRRGAYAAEIGKRAGKGTTSFGNPAEADLQVLVRGQQAYVAVDGEVTEYSLPSELGPAGTLALTVLSGTNKGYGTRCEMSGIHVWRPGD
jgi:hypothetical protein